jgi:hypothetical protein
MIAVVTPATIPLIIVVVTPATIPLIIVVVTPATIPLFTVVSRSYNYYKQWNGSWSYNY